MHITNFTEPTPLIVETFHDLSPNKVLDIGAGNGRNALHLARSGWNVEAIDNDMNALQSIQTMSDREELGIKTHYTDFQDFTSNIQYDAIICLMTLHFMQESEVSAGIAWIKQHTLPGGVVVISGFTDKNPPGTRPYLFKEDELKHYFSDWNITYYEDNVSSSIMQPETENIVTYSVTRIVAKNEAPVYPHDYDF